MTDKDTVALLLLTTTTELIVYEQFLIICLEHPELSLVTGLIFILTQVLLTNIISLGLCNSFRGRQLLLFSLQISHHWMPLDIHILGFCNTLLFNNSDFH